MRVSLPRKLLAMSPTATRTRRAMTVKKNHLRTRARRQAAASSARVSSVHVTLFWSSFIIRVSTPEANACWVSESAPVAAK